MSRQRVAIRYRILPYYAIEIEGDPRFSGVRGIGESPLKALINMRTQVARVYPTKEYSLDESIVNPEMASGWQITKDSDAD